MKLGNSLFSVGILLVTCGALADEMAITRAAKGSAALIIHDDAVGVPEMRQLRNTLVQNYGFDPNRSLLLLQDQATADQIRESLYQLIEENRSTENQVFIYLSLPMKRDPYDGTRFIPKDASEEAPWNYLDLQEIAKSLGRLRATALLIAYPGCGFTPTRALYDTGVQEARVLAELEYGDTRSVEVLGYCDREALRLQRDLESESPPADSRARTASLIEQVLQVRGTDTQGFTTAGLADHVDELGFELGVRTHLLSMPEYADVRFTFFPEPSELARFAASYAQADSVEAARELLLRVSTAAEYADASFVDGAIDLYREIARSDQAGLNLSAADRALVSLRSYALEQLSKLTGTPVTDAFLEIANDASVVPPIRGQAIYFVESRPNLETVHLNALTQMATDENETVSIAAIRALGRLNETSSGSTIRSIISGSGTERVKLAAVQALALVDDVNDQGFLLSELPKTNSIEVKNAMVKSIGALGANDGATSILLNMLSEKEAESTQRVTLRALPSVTPVSRIDEVVDAMIDHTKSTSTLTRVSTMYALGELDSSRSRRELRRQLRNDANGETVRVAAAEALGELMRNSGERVNELSAAAEQTDSDTLQVVALEALGAIGAADSLETIERALKSRNSEVRQAASLSLRRLRDFDLAQLEKSINSVDPRIRLEAARRIAREESSPGQTQMLIKLLNDNDLDVRAVAKSGLARSEEPDLEASLAEQLAEDSDNVVRREIMDVLGQRASPAALGVLLAHQELSISVRIEQLRAIAEYEDDRARLHLLESLDSGLLEVRLAAIQQLSNPKHSDDDVVRSRLEDLARNDPSQLVRQEAVKARGASWIEQSFEEPSLVCRLVSIRALGWKSGHKTNFCKANGYPQGNFNQGDYRNGGICMAGPQPEVCRGYAVGKVPPGVQCRSVRNEVHCYQ